MRAWTCTDCRSGTATRPRDTEVLALNRQALARLGGWGELTIVPRATHLFEEPWALERVATLAANWFEQHFLAAGA